MEFFTATINSWKPLLADDRAKQIVVDSLQWLSKNGKVHVHGFVIMPNHIHLLWTVLKDDLNSPSHALLSYTAHQFRRQLLSSDQIADLQSY